MMVMAFQSSPIFSLPRARLECSVFRVMLPLGVLPVSYYHGEVRREATEAARGREFRSHFRKSAQMRSTTGQPPAAASMGPAGGLQLSARGGNGRARGGPKPASPPVLSSDQP